MQKRPRRKLEKEEVTRNREREEEEIGRLR